MPLSPIEGLPVELLQPIFILSNHNVALLKTSRLISVRLSSDYIYNSVCIQYLTEVLHDRAEQSAAQTYIFASRWMTWAFFRSWVLRTYELYGCLCGLTPEEGCLDAQWPPNFDDATNMVFSRSHLPRLAFVKARMPKKLLRGPWTKDKVQFLRFLLWITSMTIDWKDPETHQTAIEGRNQAMLEGNLAAVELFNHNRRLGRVATLSTVRFAVTAAGCDRSIVYDTMFTASMWGSGISWECAELDEWCDDRVNKDDMKGQWLRTKLEELRAPNRPGKVYQGNGIGYRRLPGGELDPETGDCDDGTRDRLVVKDHKWNQEIRQFGWFYQPRGSSIKRGLHDVSRQDLGDFWTYAHGSHHAIRGIREEVWRPGRLFWLDMWIPDSTCQGVGRCTCAV